MTFAELISPLTESDFVNRYLGKEFYLSRATPDRFSRLFNWQVINNILDTHRLESPRLRLVKNGQQIDENLYIDKQVNGRGISVPIIKHSQLAKLVETGATLVIDAVNEAHKSVYDLTTVIERAVGETAQANAYIAVCDSQGFNLHWDTHDVFVVQVAGRKHWRVYNYTREHPLNNDINPNLEKPTNPVWDGILDAGDMLYLPRGWWHEAKPLNEQTIHLSFGLTQRTGIELMDWFKEQLISNAQFRTDIPKHGVDAVKGHQEELRKMINDLLETDFLQRFLTDTNARIIPKAFNNCLDIITLQTSETIDHNKSIKIAVNRPLDIELLDEKIYFGALYKKWSFHKDLLAAFQFLSKGDACTITYFLTLIPNSIPLEVKMKIIFELLKEGLIITAD